MTSDRSRRWLDGVLVVCVVLSVAGLLAGLIHGAYWLRLGPWRVRAAHLWIPVLLSSASLALVAWRRGWRGGLVLWLIVVFLYSLNGQTLSSGDTIPARHLPLSLLREANFDLDEFAFLYTPSMPYYLARPQGHVVGTHPPWAAVLALPVYALPVLRGMPPDSPLLLDLEKLAATVITALSVVVLFCALRHMTTPPIAWVVALVYAFGTSSFSTSSQALWQHGPSQLFLTLTLYCLVRSGEAAWWVWGMGGFLSGAILCRPSNVTQALPILAFVLVKHRKDVLGFALAALPAAAAFASYNWYYWGAPLRMGFAGGVFDPVWLLLSPSAAFSTAFDAGLLGVLLSPGRGLFVYSPIFVLSLLGIVLVWLRPSPVWLRYLSLAPVPLILVASKWASWWGGWSYGPRLLADLTPILSLFLVPPLELYRGKTWMRAAFAVLAAASIGLHALGAFSAEGWNWDPLDVDTHPERLWSWTGSPPVYNARRLIKELW